MILNYFDPYYLSQKVQRNEPNLNLVDAVSIPLIDRPWLKVQHTAVIRIVDSHFGDPWLSIGTPFQEYFRPIFGLRGHHFDVLTWIWSGCTQCSRDGRVERGLPWWIIEVERRCGWEWETSSYCWHLIEGNIALDVSHDWVDESNYDDKFVESHDRQLCLGWLQRFFMRRFEAKARCKISTIISHGSGGLIVTPHRAKVLRQFGAFDSKLQKFIPILMCQWLCDLCFHRDIVYLTHNDARIEVQYKAQAEWIS